MHRSITYIFITKCTVNYLLFMYNKHIFNEKYENVTYSNWLEVKAESITFLSAYIKFHWKCFKNSHYGTHSLYNVLSFSWMSIRWRLRFWILEGMTGHLEVEVAWEQHKTPWRSGLSLDEKESPWRQMDLMLPKVLSLEGTFTHLHERLLGKSHPGGNQSCDGMQ